MTVIARLTTALADRYRVERELGAGGMATVYLAHDLRHERDVAIKVLHPDLGAALGADRFLAEIKTTAKLQHPHILPLLDSGAADGLLYYVMPYVRGETLRARLERERQLPIPDAIRIAREVAGALDHAHKQGIIHRDIKPENILLQDGAAVVADFGIALAVQQAGGQRMTQTGLSLGTPQYMSPEQAMGEKAIDARTDIYALGAVTYEMLAGEPPFSGNSVQAIVAKVLTERPVPLRTVRDTVSAEIEFAVLQALAKLPADRPESATFFAAAMHTSGERAVQRPAEKATINRGWMPLAALLAIAAGVIGWFGRGMMLPTVRAETVTRFVLPMQPSELPSIIIGPQTAVSGDGSALVYVARQAPGAPPVLVQRRLDQLNVTPLKGTENATSPAFSPDARQIAFHAAGKGVFVVPSDGGTARRVAVVEWARGIAWPFPDKIVYAPDSSRVLMVGSPDGGTPKAFGQLPRNRSAWWPVALPGSDWVIFSAASARGDSVELYFARIGDENARRVGGAGVFALGRIGTHLVYMDGDGMLMASPFDSKSGQITGAVVALGVKVPSRPLAVARGLGDVVLGPAGDLLYAEDLTDATIITLRPDGREQLLVADTLPFGSVALSPDGRRIAVSIADSVSGREIVAVRDPGGDRFRRVTPADQRFGYSLIEWMPDGKRLHLMRKDAVRSVPVVRDVDSGEEELVYGGLEHVYESKIRPDGQSFVGRLGLPVRGGQQFGTWVMGASTVAVDSQFRAIVNFSPDGRRASFVGVGANGRTALYVAPYPDSGRRLIVPSEAGTITPVWRTERSVLYWSEGALHEAEVSVGTDAVLTRRRIAAMSPNVPMRPSPLTVAPDGSVIVIRPLRTSAMIFVQNCAQEVRRRVESQETKP